MTVLRWRAQVVRRLLRRPTWAVVWPGLLIAVAAWMVLLIVEVARHSFATQVGLASAGGMLTAFWSASGQLLKQIRRTTAAIDPVETERLVLRPPHSRDSLAYAASLDADMMAANGWPETLRRSSIKQMQHADRLPLANMTVIADRVTDELVGWIGLYNVDRGAGSCELGWSMAPHARGKGYGTEAIRAALEALRQNGFRRITIGTNEENQAARRVLERVGGRQISTRPHTLPNGATVTSVWYAHDAPAVDPEMAPTA